jgi:hypothetical protein
MVRGTIQGMGPCAFTAAGRCLSRSWPFVCSPSSCAVGVRLKIRSRLVRWKLCVSAITGRVRRCGVEAKSSHLGVAIKRPRGWLVTVNCESRFISPSIRVAWMHFVPAPQPCKGECRTHCARPTWAHIPDRPQACHTEENPRRVFPSSRTHTSPPRNTPHISCPLTGSQNHSQQKGPVIHKK